MPIPNGYVSGQVVQAVPIPSGIIQVVSVTKTDTFTSASTTYVDITGLTVSITPTSATSTILVIASLSGCNDQGVTGFGARLARGGTNIFSGVAAGSRTSGQQVAPQNGDTMTTLGLSVLDSPATTSATTYSIQGRNATAGTFYVNRSKSDTDSAFFFRAASSITVMEILA